MNPPVPEPEWEVLATSRGASSIYGHLERQEGGPAQKFYHPRPTKSFGGAGPVEAVAVFRVEDPPHWHLVTFGLTELHAKESGDAEWSGWGFELTLRVEGEERPRWAVDFLTSLAAYVWSGRHPFAEGHLVDLRGPIQLGSDSPITAAMIVKDPKLPVLDGPFGAVEFLQVVGLTGDELELCRRWNCAGVRELLAQDDPFLVTRLSRGSLTSDARWTAVIDERIRTEGSEMHELRIATLDIRKGLTGWMTVQLGSGASAALGPALRRELIDTGASFAVVGDHAEMRFSVGEPAGWGWDGHTLEAVVRPGDVEALAALFDGRPGSGRFAVWEKLRFHVLK